MVQQLHFYTMANSPWLEGTFKRPWSKSAAVSTDKLPSCSGADEAMGSAWTMGPITTCPPSLTPFTTRKGRIQEPRACHVMSCSVSVTYISIIIPRERNFAAGSTSHSERFPSQWRKDGTRMPLCLCLDERSMSCTSESLHTKIKTNLRSLGCLSFFSLGKTPMA